MRDPTLAHSLRQLLVGSFARMSRARSRRDATSRLTSASLRFGSGTGCGRGRPQVAVQLSRVGSCRLSGVGYGPGPARAYSSFVTRVWLPEGADAAEVAQRFDRVVMMTETAEVFEAGLTTGGDGNVVVDFEVPVDLTTRDDATRVADFDPSP